jgi:hypothetical protein
MPSRRDPKRAERIYTLIEELSLEERDELFGMLSDEPYLFGGTRYIIIPLETARKLANVTKKAETEIGKAVDAFIGLASKLVSRNRKPGKERLERGRIVRQANRIDRISWKEMPVFILKKHPEWFPKYLGNPPDARERLRLKERLRKWARDAEKS